MASPERQASPVPTRPRHSDCDVDPVSLEPFSANVNTLYIYNEDSKTWQCYDRYNLIRFMSDKDRIVALWVGGRDSEGHGGRPDLQHTFFPLTDGFTYIDKESALLISEGLDQYYIRTLLQANVPVGNLRGTFGVSELHGNNPKNVYKLTPISYDDEKFTRQDNCPPETPDEPLYIFLMSEDHQDTWCVPKRVIDNLKVLMYEMVEDDENIAPEFIYGAIIGVPGEDRRPFVASADSIQALFVSRIIEVRPTPKHALLDINDIEYTLPVVVLVPFYQDERKRFRQMLIMDDPIPGLDMEAALDKWIREVHNLGQRAFCTIRINKSALWNANNTSISVNIYPIEEYDGVPIRIWYERMIQLPRVYSLFINLTEMILHTQINVWSTRRSVFLDKPDFKTLFSFAKDPSDAVTLYLMCNRDFPDLLARKLRGAGFSLRNESFYIGADDRYPF